MKTGIIVATILRVDVPDGLVSEHARHHSKYIAASNLSLVGDSSSNWITRPHFSVRLLDVTLRVFPVVGKSTFADDFGFVKPDGRRHQGIDIHAPAGSRLVAVDDGVAKPGQDPRGGNVTNLYADDGARYYYAHGDSPGLAGRVNAGDDLGMGVGTSGNAVGTDPHLHFEWHPEGGAAADPYKLLKAAQGISPKASPISPWLIALGIVASAGLAAYIIRR